MHYFQRRGGKCPSGALELSRLRRSVAQRLTNRGYDLGNGAHKLILIGRRGLGLSESIARSCIQCYGGNNVVIAAPADLARDNRANALAERHQPRWLLIELIGGIRKFLGEFTRPAAVVGVDKAGAFQRHIEHRLQRAIKNRIAGVIGEVSH